jgi:hypothetical protein
MARRILIDHDEIRLWAEGHGGRPAIIKGIIEEEGENSLDMLHIMFDEEDDEDLQETSWEEFFERLDERNFALVIYYDRSEPIDFGFIDKERALLGDQQAVDNELPDSSDEHELKENKYSAEPPEGEPEI